MAEKNIPGFHYARAVLSIFVVLWHTHAVPRPEIWSATDVFGYVPGVLDIINFQVLLTAVPGFVAISCFLYALHGGSAHKLRARALRLAALMLFWTMLFLLVDRGLPGLETAAHWLVDSPVVALVGAFGTVYYFFMALAATLVVTSLCAGLSTRWNVALLASLCGLIGLFQWIPMHGGPQWMWAHWNPLNFAPYGPAMVLLVRYFPILINRRALAFSILLACAAAFAVIEWTTLPALTGQQPITASIPAYTRISLLPTAAAIVLACISSRATADKVVGFMSQNSLALYCLHPIALALFLGRLGEGVALGAVVVGVSYITACFVLPRTLPSALYR